MKSKPTGERSVGRRDFLRHMSAGAVGGSVAVLAVPFAGEAVASQSRDEAKKRRYNANSADVKNYYRVNRYPTR